MVFFLDVENFELVSTVLPSLLHLYPNNFGSFCTVSWPAGRLFERALETNILCSASFATKSFTVVTSAKSPSTGRSFEYFPRASPKVESAWKKKKQEKKKSELQQIRVKPLSLTAQLCLLQ